MTTGCIITHKYSHHVTLEYMCVGFVWVNYLFDYTMTNKLLFIPQTLVHSCVPIIAMGCWSQLTSSKGPYDIGGMRRMAGLDKI